MRNSTYHRILRISSLVCALVLIFESGLISKSTAVIASNTHSYLANAVGMSASVQPTEINLITAELSKKERELASRELALREREISVEISGGGGSDTATFMLAGILFILLVLILLNYILDYLRLKEARETQTVQSY